MATFWLCLAGSIATAGAIDLQTPIDLVCQPPMRESLHCEYRFTDSTSSPVPHRSMLDLSWQGTKLPIIAEATYPWPDAKTAILFLIDVSDPGRQASVELGKRHIQQIVAHKASHHVIGLASFAKQLQWHAPLGSSQMELYQALVSVQAGGKTTELYRNAISAIKALGHVDATRRLLFLLSDGLAEDYAYFNDDLVQSAHRNKVVINTLGYPRNTALSVALQTLRRMSEETGGWYQEAREQDLSAQQIDTALSHVESGGRFTASLSRLSWPERIQVNTLQLHIQSSQGIHTVPFTIHLPARMPEDIIAAAATRPIIPATNSLAHSVQPPESPASSNPAARKTAMTEASATTQRSRSDSLLNGQSGLFVDLDTKGQAWWQTHWLGLLILLLLLLLLWRLHTRPTSTPEANTGLNRTPSATPAPTLRALAYLLRRDIPGCRHAVTNTIWHIGRSRDNELCLEDLSVSRHHAALQRMDNGKFDIVDLQSSNGTFVNEEKVVQHTLMENDTIQIGHAQFYFTRHSDEDELSEATEQCQNRLA